MKYYFEEKLMVFKLEGKVHKKILLYNANFHSHIKVKHPEMTLKKIEGILKDPDYVFRMSNNNPECYYEKIIGDHNYRVVVSRRKKHVKEVVTAYKVSNEEEFTIKHTHCIYDRNNKLHYTKINETLENDKDYFYELFNVVK
ncbi:hypothetical protein CM240_0710 [Clostridium bornimense]|uniref:Phage-Barnase-EndoU-ColicinE5/D-RelE like nuclease 3 domain-containing protein n=1 Tax=Clostridium bornimense TaxID=1216932 RepID=W6SDZ7_9CLOT|nr:hypothetical protein [Clostridium bornimense]CDM67875.1 hypothetical protein CM240_0710 [Clostridium bornimense]